MKHLGMLCQNILCNSSIDHLHHKVRCLSNLLRIRMRLGLLCKILAVLGSSKTPELPDTCMLLLVVDP